MSNTFFPLKHLMRLKEMGHLYIRQFYYAVHVDDEVISWIFFWGSCFPTIHPTSVSQHIVSMR
jgi:hypothetical protein